MLFEIQTASAQNSIAVRMLDGAQDRERIERSILEIQI